MRTNPTYGAAGPSGPEQAFAYGIDKNKQTKQTNNKNIQQKRKSKYQI